MNKMGIKTTVASAVFVLMVCGLLGAWVLGKVSIEELKTAMVFLTPFFVMIIGFLAKDQNKSHTKP